MINGLVCEEARTTFFDEATRDTMQHFFDDAVIEIRQEVRTNHRITNGELKVLRYRPNEWPPCFYDRLRERFLSAVNDAKLIVGEEEEVDMLIDDTFCEMAGDILKL